MQKVNKQIKVNVPISNKELLAYCARLSEQHLLSATFIRLFRAELERQGSNTGAINRQQSIFND